MFTSCHQWWQKQRLTWLQYAANRQRLAVFLLQLTNIHILALPERKDANAEAVVPSAIIVLLLATPIKDRLIPHDFRLTGLRLRRGVSEFIYIIKYL